MKLRFKAAFLLLVCSAFFYTSCRKVKPPVPTPPTPPAPPVAVDTVAMTTISSLIARNFTQTVAGSFGGINVADGLILPGFTTQNKTKVSIGNLYDLCTFFPDTVLTYSTNIGDTIKSQTNGLYKFYFSCDTLAGPKLNGHTPYNLLSGYNAYDSLATTGKAPRDSFVYNIKTFYHAHARDTLNIPLVTNGSANTIISFDGNVKSFVDTSATKPPVKASYLHAYYTLTGLIVDLTKSGDITSGTATFAVTGLYNNIRYYYTGSMQFTGNHKVKITINSKTYNTDLITGKVTP